MTKTENRKKAPVEVVDRQSVTPLVFSQELNVGESDIASAVIHRYGPTCILFSLTGEHPVDGEACTASADMSASQAQDLISMLTKAIHALTTKKTPAEIAASLSLTQREAISRAIEPAGTVYARRPTLTALRGKGLIEPLPSLSQKLTNLGRAVAVEVGVSESMRGTQKSPAEIAAGFTHAQCRFDVGKRQRFNDCTSNTVATMKALEVRGLGKRQRIGYGSGRPDYIWNPSDLGRAVAEELKSPSNWPKWIKWDTTPK